jgi:hypothetical protein
MNRRKLLKGLAALMVLPSTALAAKTYGPVREVGRLSGRHVDLSAILARAERRLKWARVKEQYPTAYALHEADCIICEPGMADHLRKGHPGKKIYVVEHKTA